MNSPISESDIRTAAQQHGARDICVIRQRLPQTRTPEEAGDWVLLFADRQLWGRRRTLPELMLLARRGIYQSHEKKTQR